MLKEILYRWQFMHYSWSCTLQDLHFLVTMRSRSTKRIWGILVCFSQEFSKLHQRRAIAVTFPDCIVKCYYKRSHKNTFSHFILPTQSNQCPLHALDSFVLEYLRCLYVFFMYFYIIQAAIHFHSLHNS